MPPTCLDTKIIEFHPVVHEILYTEHAILPPKMNEMIRRLIKPPSLIHYLNSICIVIYTLYASFTPKTIWHRITKNGAMKHFVENFL